MEKNEQLPSTSSDVSDSSVVSDEAAKRIRGLFSDPSFSGSGTALHGFYASLKREGKDEGLSLEQVRQILSKVPTYNQQVAHTPANFPRRHVVVNGVWEIFHCDLAYFPCYDGYKYAFCLIDCGSHFGYAVSLKEKTAAATASALKTLIAANPQTLGSIGSISSDMGSEWGSQFKALLKRRNIKLYLLLPPSHASVIEQWIRSLKSRVHALARSHLTDNWPELLPEVVKGLNGSYCRSIRGIPRDLNDPKFDSQIREAHKQDQELRSHEGRRNKNLAEKDFQVGQFVYINVAKTSFDKSFDIKRTRVYEIVRVNRLQRPYLYYVKECFSGKLLQSGFYSYQMIEAPSPSENPDELFLIQEVLDKRHLPGREPEVLVKWLFYPSS